MLYCPCMPMLKPFGHLAGHMARQHSILLENRRGICVAYAWHMRGICVGYAWDMRAVFLCFSGLPGSVIQRFRQRDQPDAILHPCSRDPKATGQRTCESEWSEAKDRQRRGEKWTKTMIAMARCRQFRQCRQCRQCRCSSACADA